jgi:mono/diheme cytochrome c family protein
MRARVAAGPWISSRVARAVLCTCAGAWLAFASGAALRAQSRPVVATATPAALPADATGEAIFEAACVTCHGKDGRGATSNVVGFALPLPDGHDFPDFTDCPTNTVEPMADWMAVVHSGGPVRGLDRHMPAFGDALSDDQIERVVRYLWSFCHDRRWPRGDLNFPRAIFTEKAFPENEAVFVTGSRPGLAGLNETFIYEHRYGSRGTWEVSVPFTAGQIDAGGPWRRGIGDVEISVRQTLHASFERGRILAVGGAVTLPTGRERLGLGNGYSVVEPFLLAGQMLGANGFVQVQAAYEIPTDRTRAVNEGLVRTAFGYSFAQAGGRGRSWTPMAEVMVARPADGSAEWDVVPQMQVSLSKLQHVLMSVGVRLPVNERLERKPELATYLIWDWFDGGFFRFWK